tara:strand:+ start:34 stop:630 length:597 start_codon:yes stop_codon:yes gene_type:complete
MPIIKIKKTKDYIYGLWKIEETINELLSKLSPNKFEKKQLGKISHLQRKKQSISAKLILNELLQKKITILYEKQIPYCEEHSNISISHSDKYSAVLISTEKIGIDLQKEERKIENIKTKFLHKTENIKYSLKELHYIWTAKEAIYKTIKNERCSFKENIFLSKKMKTGYYINKSKKIEFDLEIKKIKKLYLTIAKLKK